MTIENSIKEIRMDKGLTQEELAEVLGVSRQTIIAMEKGSYVPSLLLAMQVARFFKLHIENIFSLKK
ncbi:MAG TPA: helix-turn-helix transcriptional regulator [Patescibacteria group bacterium]|nr:helix-turn-helix transcriptional regulator [Patescibacteria group bacterium]